MNDWLALWLDTGFSTMTNQEIAGHLEGVFTPVVTPFNRRGGVDESAFRANLRRHSGSGLSGVVVAGSTGEAPHLTCSERLRLIDLARAIVKPPELLIAGTGLESTAQTLELSREAAARGADAVLILPPSYYKSAMRVDVLETHFRAVADGVRCPLLVYSIPQFTGFQMDVAMIARLSRRPNIAGIKESSGNLDFVRAILRQKNSDFRLLIGSALIFLDGLRAGAAGGVLGQSNFETQLCLSIYETFLQGDEKTAEKLGTRLKILAEKITAPYGIAGVKAALDLCGYAGGDPRPPLLPLNATARRNIASALKLARAGLDV